MGYKLLNGDCKNPLIKENVCVVFFWVMNDHIKQDSMQIYLYHLGLRGTQTSASRPYLNVPSLLFTTNRQRIIKLENGTFITQQHSYLKMNRQTRKDGLGCVK